MYKMGENEIGEVDTAYYLHRDAQPLPVQPNLAHVKTVAFKHRCALHSVLQNKQDKMFYLGY
jgi:hypothetical protein